MSACYFVDYYYYVGEKDENTQQTWHIAGFVMLIWIFLLVDRLLFSFDLMSEESFL